MFRFSDKQLDWRRIIRALCFLLKWLCSNLPCVLQFEATTYTRGFWAGFIWWAISDAWTWVGRVSWASLCIVCRLCTRYSSTKGQSSAASRPKILRKHFPLWRPILTVSQYDSRLLSSQSGPGISIKNSTELLLEQGRSGDDSRSKSIVTPKLKWLRQKSKYGLCSSVCLSILAKSHQRLLATTSVDGFVPAYVPRLSQPYCWHFLQIFRVLPVHDKY